MTAATPADIGPFAGREGEPVPEQALLAQHALALYWAALDAGDAIESLLMALDDDDDEHAIDAARARMRQAEVRLWKSTNAVRVPTLEALAKRAQVTP